jgi:hypothetical protein
MILNDLANESDNIADDSDYLAGDFDDIAEPGDASTDAELSLLQVDNDGIYNILYIF